MDFIPLSGSSSGVRISYYPVQDIVGQSNNPEAAASSTHLHSLAWTSSDEEVRKGPQYSISRNARHSYQHYTVSIDQTRPSSPSHSSLP